jgi:hypothetical protein
MIDILKQAPRLHLKAAKRTDDVNEAYMMVHGAMARAMDRSATETMQQRLHPHLTHALSRIVGAALERPLAPGEIGHRVAR